jgi:hypothetical protein
METRSLIIAGSLLFALGGAAGLLFAPHQSVTPISQTSSATGSLANNNGGDSAHSASASSDSAHADSSSLNSPTQADVDSLLRQAMFGPSDRKRRHALALLADGLDPAQIQSALQTVQKSGGQNKTELVSELLGQWAATDPQGATQYALALSSPTDRDSALTAIASSWAEANPKAAEAWALSLQDHGAREAAISGIMDTVAATDPQQAFAFLQSLPAADAAASANAIFSAWAANDAQGAAAAIAKMPQGDLQQTAIEALATAWAAKDSASAIAWVLTLSTSGQQFDASRSIAAVTASTDPQATANFGLQLAGGHGRVVVLQAALQSWMSQDPSGALAWLQQVPDQDTKSDVAGMAANEAVKNSPAQAAQIALMMSPGPQQDSVLQRSLSSWYQADPNAAMAWAQQQTNPQIEAAVFPSIAGQMANTDVQGAITFAQALTGDAQANAINSIITTWAGNDPAAAVAYVAQQPDGENKTGEIETIAATWEENRPSAANQWLASLPAGPAKDAALQAAANSANPAAGETLLAGVGNDQIRVATETQIANNWMDSNPTAARTWIQNSDLPQQTKDLLLGGARSASQQ